MALTILYRHRDWPDEAGITMIAAPNTVTAMVDQLERRGFVVEKVTVRSTPARLPPLTRLRSTYP